MRTRAQGTRLRAQGSGAAGPRAWDTMGDSPFLQDRIAHILDTYRRYLLYSTAPQPAQQLTRPQPGTSSDAAPAPALALALALRLSTLRAASGPTKSTAALCAKSAPRVDGNLTVSVDHYFLVVLAHHRFHHHSGYIRCCYLQRAAATA